MIVSAERNSPAGPGEGVDKLLRRVTGNPALHLWNPPHCGSSEIRIAADGTWIHQGTPILRPAMVRLFAGILRRDPEGFVLVTPAEKLSIEVEDAPFIAVEMHGGHLADRPRLCFRTNVGDEVAAGPDNPLRFARDRKGGVIPYVLVRGELWARLTRPLAFELLQRAEDRPIGGTNHPCIESDGALFALPCDADNAGAA